MRLTPCECQREGWCVRHGCFKSAPLVRKCQLDVRFFQYWEQGRGPGQCASPPRAEPCRHLGETVSEEPCPTCKGAVRVKVFECALHGKCTKALQISSLACCQACRDYDVANGTVVPSTHNGI